MLRHSDQLSIPFTEIFLESVIDHTAAIRAAVQAVLDAEGDGYQVAQLVVGMGLERISDGAVESTAWVWSPPDQPHWQTTALLHEALELHEARTDCDDD